MEVEKIVNSRRRNGRTAKRERGRGVGENGKKYEQVTKGCVLNLEVPLHFPPLIVREKWEEGKNVYRERRR